MEKKKKTNFKRKRGDGTGAHNVEAKLQKIKEIANNFPVALTQKISISSEDFSPKKGNMKSARPMSADFHRSPVRQIQTSKSEVNISTHISANKNPIPKLEPLPEETELKQGKKKRKSLSPNPGSRSPNRQPKVVAKIDSKSPKKPRKQGSPTKIKTGSKDGNIVPFAEVIKTRFPLLKDEELVKRFQSVTMSNNQKGRIRQTLKGIFEGTTTNMLPDIIYNKIQHILQSRENLTDAELRKIRVLYNMLKVATEIEMKNAGRYSLPSSLKKESINKRASPESFFEAKPVQTQAVQANRRYVVFIGNLPLDVKRDQLLDHFDEFRMYIKDIRIPQPKEGKNSAIAYVELVNEAAFEMALSRHHTMFENRRINVLYSKQQKSKMTKAEAKAKAAKMVALVKSGHLIGSLPLKKKRSHRRAIMKQAQKAANDNALAIKAL